MIYFGIPSYVLEEVSCYFYLHNRALAPCEIGILLRSRWHLFSWLWKMRVPLFRVEDT